MADLKAMRDADWWDDPWIPVKVDTLRALLDCAEALQIDVTAELAAVEEWNKLYPRIPWKENHAVVEGLKVNQAALAQVEKAP